VPNFALYIMGAMARRIRGMTQAMCEDHVVRMTSMQTTACY
jgi:hypothetical protein